MVKQWGAALLLSAGTVVSVQAAQPMSEQHIEIFANAGLNFHSVSFDTGDASVDASDESDAGYHLGLGVRRAFDADKHHWLGFRLDFEEVLGDSMIGFRAIDYQYAWDDNWRLSAFFGAASIDTGASQTGYYLGGGVEYRNIIPQLDIGLDLRYGDRLARDLLLDDDPDSDGPDMFYDVISTSVYLSWRF